jgi:PilZ domain
MISATENAFASAVYAKRFDRRRTPRYAFTADVELVDLESGMALAARTADLSRGGCYVDMFSPLPANRIVKLRLTKWHQTFEALAKVVYSATGMGMGLAFTAADSTQQLIIESWIAKLAPEAC